MMPSKCFTREKPRKHREVATDLQSIGSDIQSGVQTDSQARLESKEFEPDAQRNEKLKQDFHFIVRLFLGVAAIVFIAMFTIRMLHFIFPDEWCWLKPDRLQAIDKSLFSGAMGGLITSYLKQIVPTGKK